MFRYEPSLVTLPRPLSSFGRLAPERQLGFTRDHVGRESRLAIDQRLQGTG